MPEVEVCTEAVIRRPVGEVAPFAADPTNAPRWYRNITSVRWETSPPAAVGSRVSFVVHFLGRHFAYTYEIVELLPNERLVMRTAQGPFPMETTYTWEPVGEHATRMTLRNRGEPRGFGAIAAPMVARAMHAATTKDLTVLKRLLEAPAS